MKNQKLFVSKNNIYFSACIFTAFNAFVTGGSEMMISVIRASVPR